MSEPDSNALKSIMMAAAMGVAIAAQTPAPPSPAELIVPPGFKASVFASDLAGARLMTVSPEGTLLVARRPRSEVVALRQDAGGNTPATPEVILSNLTNAHSLAFKDGWLYIATTPAVLRVRWANGRPQGEPEKVVDLPASTPSLHVSRTINFGPDGRLYVSIGSSCNVCVEPDPRRTTIQVLKGGRPSGIENFASGFLKDGVILGRPAGLATGRDGALYVSDDNKGFIYRISYESH